MISVPCGTGDIPCGYDICCADDIRFAYKGTDIISYRDSDIALKYTTNCDIISSTNKKLTRCEKNNGKVIPISQMIYKSLS